MFTSTVCTCSLVPRPPQDFITALDKKRASPYAEESWEFSLWTRLVYTCRPRKELFWHLCAVNWLPLIAQREMGKSEKCNVVIAQWIEASS